MSASRPIALMDSGLGALTVLAALRERAPAADIVYFADTAHVPYGERALDDIADLGWRMTQRLSSYSPSVIVVASGSTCAGFDACGWPEADVPIVGTVEPGARAALAASRGGPIAIIATTATVRSRVFARALDGLRPGTATVGIPAPALVPIVEAGEWASERARRAVAISCRPAIAARCDALVLGCTHFGHLITWFAQTLGPSVAIVDPAVETASDALAAAGDTSAGSARTIFEVSGDVHEFRALASRLGAPALDELRHVELTQDQPAARSV